MDDTRAILVGMLQQILLLLLWLCCQYLLVTSDCRVPVSI